jgi:hydroxymethylpyrimidine/phosphomethylpyrimidine kinase
LAAMTPRILIIAGSDSGGGAGIQADIKTVTMLGGHAMTAITAITAQNTLGVQAMLPVPAEMVIAQINSVVTDIGVDAVKIGMLGSAETARAVAEWLGANINVPVVFDPVMVATSGDVLAGPEMLEALHEVRTWATLTTPNLIELEALGGLDALNADGEIVLVKGGHIEGDVIVDRLVGPDGELARWSNPRIPGKGTHGTGCTLASAIATGMGAGMTLVDATNRAIAFVRAAIANAPGLGKGQGPMGHSLGTAPFDWLQGHGNA